MDQITTIDIVGFDYDGTIADTFTKSPNGIGVEACYRAALRDMFRQETLLDDIGGLKNRASAEVIAAVLELDPSLGKIGYEYFVRHEHALRLLVPNGKGVNLKKASISALLTETLVRARLSYLLPEIGQEWPKPFEGVLECLEAFERQGISVGVISAGHTHFIEKTFDVWDVSRPRFLITDDDMRMLDLPPAKACKPSRVLMDLLLISAGRFARPRVQAYVGDCEIRDRGLASNSDVRFGWFNPKQKPAPKDFGTRDEFQFWSWHDLPHLLN